MQPQLFFSVFLVALFTLPLYSQEKSGPVGGAYGYTSVNYDPSSNTVTIYAETEVDDDSYYSPAVDTTVSNREGHLFTSGSSNSPCRGGAAASKGSGSDIAHVTCKINNANRNDVYTATSVHTVTTYVTDGEEGTNNPLNYDIDGYHSFASDDLMLPFSNFYDPPYLLEQTPSKRLSLGETMDSDTTGTTSACGDARGKV